MVEKTMTFYVWIYAKRYVQNEYRIRDKETGRWYSYKPPEYPGFALIESGTLKIKPEYTDEKIRRDAIEYFKKIPNTVILLITKNVLPILNLTRKENGTIEIERDLISWVRRSKK